MDDRNEGPRLDAMVVAFAIGLAFTAAAATVALVALVRVFVSLLMAVQW